MSLDGVSPTGAPNVDTDNDGVFDTYDPTVAAPEDTASTPPNDPSSALDTFEIMAEDGDPATMKFLYELTGATTEQEMMDAINANPLAFLRAVFAWAQANGVTGTDDELISKFLDRLRADMGFGTSSPGVPEENMIRLNGADDRTIALVSAIGQMILEKYGAEAYAEYRAKVEADWADDGALSDETLIMLDDTLSSAEANYVPTYDADGNLLAPPPEVRIAQLYIQLAKDSGAIDAAKAYNDIAAQTLFQTGMELGEGTDPSVPTPLGDLLAALQKMNAVNAAYEENQRKFDDGEITEDEYLKTESLLNVQLTEARTAVSETAEAAGMDANEMLRKATAEGFVMALTDPETAAEVEALWLKRQEHAALEAEVKTMLGNGMDINSPEVRGRLNRMAELDKEMAGLETTLNGKGIATTDDPHAWPGEDFDDLYHGIFRVREGKLDQAYAAETTAATNGAPPSYGDLVGQIEKLAALRAEYDQIAVDEAAGIITPGVAETKRANLATEIGALEAELAGLAEANGLAADTFTDPGKSAGYIAAMKNDDLGPLFGAWRNKTSELATAEAQVAEMEAAGTLPDDPALVAKREEVARLRAEISAIEGEIRIKMNGGDPALIPELDTKRAARDAAYQAWQAKLQAAQDAGVLDLNGVTEAYNAYETLDAEVKALEARVLPTGGQWNGDIAAVADGAIAADGSGADVGWRIETDPAYFAGYQTPDVLTGDQMTQLLAYQKAVNDAYADGSFTADERAALVPMFREVAGFMPPSFFGTENFAAMDPADAAFDAILVRSGAILGGSFAEGLAQRTSEITVENEQILMDADVATVLAKLFEAAGGKLKGESASAHVQYVLQMLGINMTAADVETFLAGGVLPPAKEKAMLLAAQFFAQSQGATVDDAAALNMLRNALKGDMGRAESDPGVDKWEEFTYAGTEETDSGSPATPQTEFLRSMLSVLHEIYAEVYGEEEAAKLDSEVGPRFYDGAITPTYSYKDYATRGGDTGTAETFEYYELGQDHWDPETGQVFGFDDKPWINMEWKFSVVLTKEVHHEHRSGDYTETLVEHIDPNDQARIAELKAEGYTIARVEAKEASEPQRMMARLIEGLIEYMKTYKPVYDADGNLTNPPPLARIAQYFVQTEFAADVAGRDYDYQDPDEQITGWESYRIDDTGVHMSDTDAIKFMFKELGMPEDQLQSLFGMAGTQLDDSSTIGGFDTKGDAIAFAVFDGVFFFGLFGFLGGLFDKISTDPLTDFANDNLGNNGRDNWRAEHRDKMDDPSWVDIFVDALLIGAEVATLGIPLSAARFARIGAEVADAAMDGSRAGRRTVWDMPDADGNTWRDVDTDGNPAGPVAEARDNADSLSDPSESDYLYDPDDVSTSLDWSVSSSDGSVRWQNSDSLDGVFDGANTSDITFSPVSRHSLSPRSPEIQPFPDADVPDPARPVGAPTEQILPPTTDKVYRWEAGVTYETPPLGADPQLSSNVPGVYTIEYNGVTENYVWMRTPDGKMTWVRVEQAPQPQPAIPGAPVDDKWYIYSPVDRKGGPGATPEVKKQPGEYWTTTDTTLVTNTQWNDLLKNGNYTTTPQGYGVPSDLPGATASLVPSGAPSPGDTATRTWKDYQASLVSQLRLGGNNTVTMPPGYNILDAPDGKSMLDTRGKKAYEGNADLAADLETYFKLAKERRGEIELGLYRAREDQKFFEYALREVEKKDPKMTWAEFAAARPELASALRARSVIPESTDDLAAVTGKLEKEIKANKAEIVDLQKALVENENTVLAKVSVLNELGNTDRNANWWPPLRNSLITAAALGVPTLLILNGIVVPYIQRKFAPPAAGAAPQNVTATISVDPGTTKTVDVGLLAGKTGDGYTYTIPREDQLNGLVTIDPKTGEVTINSTDDPTLDAGSTEVVTVVITDDATGKKTYVQLTIEVGEDPADQAA